MQLIAEREDRLLNIGRLRLSGVSVVTEHPSIVLIETGNTTIDRSTNDTFIVICQIAEDTEGQYELFVSLEDDRDPIAGDCLLALIGLLVIVQFRSRIGSQAPGRLGN